MAQRLLCGIFLFVLVACSRSGAPENKQGAGLAAGTGDSGGGNSYRGKPLESYIKKPMDIPGVRATIAPLMNALAANHINLHQIFSTTLDGKAWYFVPGPLQSLPPGKIGSAVPTDQVALQGFESVWIDADLFAQMDPSEQGNLVLHELLMGLRLLKFDSYKHACLAISPDASLCDNASDLKMGSPGDLTDNDYAHIRNTVPQILRAYGQMTYEDWEDLMGREGFSFSAREFQERGQLRNESLATIQNWLQMAQATKNIPTYGFDFEHLMEQHPELKTNPPTHEVSWDSHERCSVDFQMKQNEISFQLRLGERNLSFAYSYVDTVRLQRRSHYGTSYWEARMEGGFSPGAKYKLGDRAFDVLLGFESEGRLGYLELREMACANSDCSTWMNPGDGLSYICDQFPTLQYK